MSLSLFRLAASFYEFQTQKESKPARSSFTAAVERASRVFCGCFCFRLSVEQLARGEKMYKRRPFGVEKKKACCVRKKRASLEEEERERNKCPPFLHRLLLPIIRLRFFGSARSRWLYSETRLLFSSFRYPRAARAFIFTGRS